MASSFSVVLMIYRMLYCYHRGIKLAQSDVQKHEKRSLVFPISHAAINTVRRIQR